MCVYGGWGLNLNSTRSEHWLSSLLSLPMIQIGGNSSSPDLASVFFSVAQSSHAHIYVVVGPRKSDDDPALLSLSFFCTHAQNSSFYFYKFGACSSFSFFFQTRIRSSDRIETGRGENFDHRAGRAWMLCFLSLFFCEQGPVFNHDSTQLRSKLRRKEGRLRARNTFLRFSNIFLRLPS